MRLLSIRWLVSAAVLSSAVLSVGIADARLSLPGQTVLESIDVDGVMRDALVYVPTRAMGTGQLPAMLILHGRGVDMLFTAHALGFREEAERVGFIAVIPNGRPAPAPAGGTVCCGWNDGRPTWGDQQPADDVAFIARLLDLLIEKYPVDQHRISAAGISNGAFMSHRLACEMSDRIVAIAAVAGTRNNAECASMRRVSVLSMHGTADPLAPFEGGPDSRNIVEPTVAETTQFWRTHNGCAGRAATRTLNPVVEVQAYNQCADGTAVHQYIVVGGMHCWPGVEFNAPYCLTGGPHMAFAATPVVVDFLVSHARTATP
jgi:polyhydroxybutyrate depolymerase